MAQLLCSWWTQALPPVSPHTFLHSRVAEMTLLPRPHCRSHLAQTGTPGTSAGTQGGHSARGNLVDVLQTSQQSVIGVSRYCNHLEHRLEGPAIKLLLYLVSVKVRGHQAEEVRVHLLQFAHPADDVGKAGGEVKGTRLE